MPAAALKEWRARSGVSPPPRTLVWLVAQGLGVYNDLVPSASVSWTENLLFCFWFVPLAMAIVPRPGAGSRTPRHPDRAATLCRRCWSAWPRMCISFTCPRRMHRANWRTRFGRPTSPATDLSRVRSYCAAVDLALARCPRALFGRVGIFLALSGCVDALYYYGPGRGLNTGAWFDLLWSALLVVPLVIACHLEAGGGSVVSQRSTAARKDVSTRKSFT